MNKKTIAYLIVPYLFWSCEEVIEIDLNDAAPQLVIEGHVENSAGPFTVRISETTNFFGESGVMPVDVENVVISTGSGQQERLVRRGAGIYETTELSGVPDETYQITVSHEGREITATSTMPPPIEINRLEFVFDDREFNPAGESGYELTCFFNDPVNEANYYRFLIYLNGELLDDDGLYLFDDEFSDGNLVNYAFFDQRFDLQDTVEVELLSLDEQTYDYYLQLNELFGGSPGFGSAAPGNPTSLYSEEVLGVFAAYSKNTITHSVIIQ